MKKITALLVITGIFGYLYLMDFEPLVKQVVSSNIEKIIDSDKTSTKGFKVLFCGTGSPNRTQDRAQPCTAVQINDQLFLFDAGEGAVSSLQFHNAPLSSLSRIFITHLHSDHMSGVAEVLHNSWLYNRGNDELTVMGPPGTQQMLASIRSVYEEDINERVEAIGIDRLNPKKVFHQAQEIEFTPGNAHTVFNENGILIEAFHVDHGRWKHAYGYRISYAGKSIVISGDTAPSAAIVKYSKDADILIHEALNKPLMDLVGKKMDELNGPIDSAQINDIAAVHTDTLALAKMAQQANVKKLILTHLIPAIPANFIAEQFFTSGMNELYTGDIQVARDGLWINLTTQ